MEIYKSKKWKRKGIINFNMKNYEDYIRKYETDEEIYYLHNFNTTFIKSKIHILYYLNLEYKLSFAAFCGIYFVLAILYIIYHFNIEPNPVQLFFAFISNNINIIGFLIYVQQYTSTNEIDIFAFSIPIGISLYTYQWKKENQWVERQLKLDSLMFYRTLEYLTVDDWNYITNQNLLSDLICFMNRIYQPQQVLTKFETILLSNAKQANIYKIINRLYKRIIKEKRAQRKQSGKQKRAASN